MAIGYTEHSFLWIVNNIYFQYFSLLIAFVSAVTMVGRELPDGIAQLRADQGA